MNTQLLELFFGFSIINALFIIFCRCNSAYEISIDK